MSAVNDSDLKTLLSEIPGARELNGSLGDGRRVFEIGGRFFAADRSMTDSEIAKNIRFALSRARR